MNIKHYLSAMAALAMLAACSDYDPGMSENAINLNEAEEQLINEYTANFVQRYGEIDPNHTWGFGEIGSEDEMGTRHVDTQRNQWTTLITENGEIKAVSKPNSWNENYEGYFDNTDESKIGWKVPGFPSDVDGYYYTDEGVFHSESEMTARRQQGEVHPIGDVTDEEIQYVSEWFRTNQNPPSQVPEFTEFYIQDISQDYDRETYPNGSAINMKLNVYEGGTRDEDGYFTGGTLNGTDEVSFGMDYFAVHTTDNAENGGWEHESNFNAQKANHINGTVPNNQTTFPERTLKYWLTNGGYTDSFMYYNSNQSQKYENYVLVHLSFDGPRTGRHYEGYYLAFDYQYQKIHSQSTDGDGNTVYKYSQRKPDGYYSNWIVKLSPADPQWSDHDWHRIMCEDLGNTYDFDFNDLVYDVYYTGESGNYTAHIKVQAAGGTLPIYLGSDTREVHQLFGQQPQANGNYLPVNVGTSSTKTPVEFTIENLPNTNPDNIAIYVKNKNATTTAQDGNRITLLPPVGQSVSLAPQKICIPNNTTKWTKESQQIEWAYLNFDQWVQVQNGEYGFEGAKPWNKKVEGENNIDETKLF